MEQRGQNGFAPGLWIFLVNVALPAATLITRINCIVVEGRSSRDLAVSIPSVSVVDPNFSTPSSSISVTRYLKKKEKKERRCKMIELKHPTILFHRRYPQE